MQIVAVAMAMVLALLVVHIVQAARGVERKLRMQQVADAAVLSAASAQALALNLNAVANSGILALHGLEFSMLASGGLTSLGMLLSVVAAPQGARLLQETVDATREVYKINQRIAALRDDVNRLVAPGLALGLFAWAAVDGGEVAVPYPLWGNDPRWGATGARHISRAECERALDQARPPEPRATSAASPAAYAPSSLPVQAYPPRALRSFLAQLLNRSAGGLVDQAVARGTAAVASATLGRVEQLRDDWTLAVSHATTSWVDAALDAGVPGPGSAAWVRLQGDAMCAVARDAAVSAAKDQALPAAWIAALADTRQALATAQTTTLFDAGKAMAALGAPLERLNQGTATALAHWTGHDVAAELRAAYAQHAAGLVADGGTRIGGMWRDRLTAAAALGDAAWVRAQVAGVEPSEAPRRLCMRVRAAAADLEAAQVGYRDLARTLLSAAVATTVARVHAVFDTVLGRLTQLLDSPRAFAQAKVQAIRARIICGGDQGLFDDFPLPTFLSPDFYATQVIGAVVIDTERLGRGLPVALAQAQPFAVHDRVRPGAPIFRADFDVRLMPLDFPLRFPGLDAETQQRLSGLLLQ